MDVDSLFFWGFKVLCLWLTRFVHRCPAHRLWYCCCCGSKSLALSSILSSSLRTPKTATAGYSGSKTMETQLKWTNLQSNSQTTIMAMRWWSALENNPSVFITFCFLWWPHHPTNNDGNGGSVPWPSSSSSVSVQSSWSSFVPWVLDYRQFPHLPPVILGTIRPTTTTRAPMTMWLC